MQETEDFLSRVYRGSLSLMLSAMTEKTTLDDEEIAQIYEILRKAEEANKA